MAKSGMTVCIFGSRELDESDFKLVDEAVKASGFKIKKVLSGGANGGDFLGEQWANANNIPVKVYKPDWKNLNAPGAVVKDGKYGKYNHRAGLDRDDEMAKDADAGIWLCPDGITSGSQYTAKSFDKLKKSVFVWPEQQEEKVESEVGYAYVF